jgi:hypothetical protein
MTTPGQSSIGALTSLAATRTRVSRVLGRKRHGSAAGPGLRCSGYWTAAVELRCRLEDAHNGRVQVDVLAPQPHVQLPIASAGVEAVPQTRRVIPVTTHARPSALQYIATMTRTKARCSAVLCVFATTAAARPSCTE